MVQTAKQEWKNQPSGTLGLVKQERTVSRERERTGSTKSVKSRQDTGRTGDRTMIRKQREYGKRQRQKKTTTGVLLQEQCHSKRWKQEV